MTSVSRTYWTWHFTYQAGSIRIDNTVADCAATCDAAEEAVIYAAAEDNTPLTDAAADDTASFAALTVDAGNSVVGANAQLDVAANTVLALVFTVVVP